ncbi:MAG TPA: hypothetical protein VJP60_02705 [Rhizomicrobium sp.]|nr:hypothetical protein [Rhizomicrobium sp.]
MAKEIAETIAPLQKAIQVVVGDQLSSVTFVMDYWQLAFDGHVFSVFTRLSVTRGATTVQSGENGFRDLLCEQITQIVNRIDFVDGILAVTFADGSAIHAFARDEDYRHPCPEALTFESYKFKTMYVV